MSDTLTECLTFEKADEKDTEELGSLYDDVCEYLESTVNWPGWSKGEYPCLNDVRSGIGEGSMYICRKDGRTAGAVVLNHLPDRGYDGVAWQGGDDYSKVFVVHKLAVHPDFMHRGIGAYVLSCAEKVAAKENVTSLRLAVVKGNEPAENLYERCGYRLVETKSLGYEEYGLPLFGLYEKLI